MSIRLNAAALIVVGLYGCVNSSGVIKIGPDTYTISTSTSPAKGGLPGAKRVAYQEATEECARQGGLDVYTLSEKSSSPTWTDGMSHMELNFRCLSAGDPEFKRQQVLSSPDETIEIHPR